MEGVALALTVEVLVGSAMPRWAMDWLSGSWRDWEKEPQGPRSLSEPPQPRGWMWVRLQGVLLKRFQEAKRDPMGQK